MSVRDIHADDYALSHNTSKDILELLCSGKLDSISILTNMSCFEECAAQLLEESVQWNRKPEMTVHLNFLEGHCVADPAKIPHLVDKEGYFAVGWKDLFVFNYLPFKYQIIKEELKKEIKAQTERFIKLFGQDMPLRFDGHQHTQMIPIVYKALSEVIKEEKYKTEYIRVTKEPIKPFLKNRSLWRSYKPVNIIKNVILNLYALGMEWYLKKRIGLYLHPMYLWGVWMSGKMDTVRVKCLYGDMMSLAAKRGRVLEILFHPGTLLEKERGKEYNNTDAVSFYISDGRKAEYKCAEAVKQFS